MQSLPLRYLDALPKDKLAEIAGYMHSRVSLDGMLDMSLVLLAALVGSVFGVILMFLVVTKRRANRIISPASTILEDIAKAQKAIRNDHAPQAYTGKHQTPLNSKAPEGDVDTPQKSQENLIGVPNKSLLPRNGTGGFIDPNVVDKINDVSRRPAISSDGKVIPHGKTEADAITIRNKRNLDADGYLVKGDQKLKYNEDGFPIFDSKYDTVLDDVHFGTQNEYAHFQAANESLARQLRENPALANQMGLTQQQVKFFGKVPAEGIAPPGLTWHHHQDLGRMQLVDEVQHKLFKHTGGMSIWGGGYK